MKKEKPYCEGRCGYPLDKFRGLAAKPLTKKGHELWVHLCFKPTREVWESYIEPCEECFSEFSSPWETICIKCWKRGVRGADSSDAEYKGWVWGRSVLPRSSYEALLGLCGKLSDLAPDELAKI